MKPTMALVSAACSLALSFGTARTARAAGGTPACTAHITRATVVPCALSASLTLRAEELGLDSLEGRRTTAGIVLPSNPALSLAGAHPIAPGLSDRTPLWSASLSQEVEVAGQRGARLALVSVEQRSQQQRVVAAQRAIAVDALNAYFDALAAIEEAKIADRLMVLAAALSKVAHARAQLGVASDVDASLAEVASVRLTNNQIGAQQRVATTSATLATMLGANPMEARPALLGELLPLDVLSIPAPALVESALARRADLAMASAEKDMQEKRANVFQRSRVPNPTFSLFARKDWVGEELIGVGVSFPIPLPAPVGQTHAGEIQEATALARRGDTDVERLKRTIRLEVVRAMEVATSRKRQLDSYAPEQVTKTQAALVSIAEEIDARRLSVREALLTQQGLIDFLSGYVEAKRSLCQASVEVARAGGLPLERGAP